MMPTLRQGILERLSAKHFDGLSLVPLYLKEDLDSLEHLLQIVTEMLTDELTSPFLKEHKVSPPSPRPLQESDVVKMVRSIEEDALIDMFRWAGDRQAVFRLLDARRQTALEVYKGCQCSEETEAKQPLPSVPASNEVPNPPVAVSQTV